MKKQLAAAALILLAAASLPASAQTGEDFAPCGDAASDPRLAGSLCAHFRVPAVRGTASGKMVTLSLRKFPAAGSVRGQVWLVAGEQGAALTPLIATMRQAFPGYDLIVPDRRSQPVIAAQDLQAEIDRYSGADATLLYGASQGGEVVLKTLPLVKPRRVEAVILDSPALPGQRLSIESPAAPGASAPAGTGLDLSPPRTLVLQGGTESAPPVEIEKNAPVTTYTIEGAPNFLMLNLPECAAPLVRGFVEGGTAEGAPCAGRLSIRF